MDITLSIVMPVFNHPQELKVMMDSILANSFADWELIAVDDGSDESTLSMLADYASNDNRIHFVSRNRNPKGAQTCRNMGLEMARGKYVVFFDSDDYVAPYCLQQRVELMEEKQELDFMVFPSGAYARDSFSYKGKYVFGYQIYRDDLQAFIRRTLPFTVWTNIYRTESLRKEKLNWDTQLFSFQDSDFNIQALLHGLKYEYAIVQPDYGYRTEDNTSSISKKVASNSHRQSLLYFLNKQYNEIQHAYGKKYNSALNECALFIFSFVMSTGIDVSFAKEIARIVNSHDGIRGKLLYSKINLSNILGKLLSAKLARQLPMSVYLLHKWLLEKEIPKRIEKRMI